MRSSRIVSFSRKLILLLCGLAGLSCHESLPSFDDPGDLFTGTIDGKYVLTETDHAIWLCMRITNRFDETIQAKASISGTVTITSASDTTLHRTLYLGVPNIIHGPYDPRTGILTMDPDSSLELSTRWDFRDDWGNDVRDEWHFFADTACSVRGRSAQSFYISGQLKLIEHAHSAYLTPIVFTRSFANKYVSSKVCGVATNELPCE